ALRAEVLFEQKNYQQVLDSFDEYLRHEGKPTALHYQAVAHACFALDQYPEAIAAYSRSLQLDPGADGPGPDQKVRLYERGRAYLLVQSTTKARADFDAVIKIDPKNGEAHAYRAFAHVRLGEYAPALADATRAVELARRNPEVLGVAAAVFAQIVAAID